MNGWLDYLGKFLFFFFFGAAVGRCRYTVDHITQTYLTYYRKKREKKRKKKRLGGQGKCDQPPLDCVATKWNRSVVRIRLLPQSGKGFF